MTNKFISIILSVIFIFSIGTVPVALAEEGVTSIFDVNFESWTAGTKYNEGFTVTAANYGVADDAGTSCFTVGSYFSGELVSLKDSKGLDTKAFKLVSNEISDLNKGSGRFTFVPASTINLQDRVYVQQFSIYVPESGSIGSFNLGTIGKSGNNLNLRYLNNSGDTKNKTMSTLNTGWNKITSVQVGSDGKNIIFFHNGKTLSYKEYGNSTATSRMQFTGSSTEGQYLIFDDFKVYEGAAVTSAASSYAGQTKVKINSELTVDFTNMLIDTEINGSDSLGASNVEITNLSDGTNHTVDDLTLTNDGKTINIKTAAPLDYGTEYKVEVTGLRDMHDNIVPSYSFTFTTEPIPEVIVSKPEFTLNKIFDKDWVPSATDKLANGDMTLSFDIENTKSDKAKNVVAFVIIRNNGVLKGLQFKNKTLVPNEKQTVNMSFRISDKDTQTVEFYVWDNFTDKNALSPSYTISADGINNSKDE